MLPRSLVDVVESGQSGRIVTSVGGTPFVVIGVPIAESTARYYELLSLDAVESTLQTLGRNLSIGAAAVYRRAFRLGLLKEGAPASPPDEMSLKAAE